MKSELTFSREAANAGRAERVVMRYSRVRIGVRGNAFNAPPSASTVVPAVRPEVKILCSIPFSFLAGDTFLDMEKDFSSGRSSTKSWEKEGASNSVPRAIFLRQWLSSG